MQVLLGTKIWLTITKGHVADNTSINNPSLRKPLVCNGILDPDYSKKLNLLVKKPIDAPLAINYKITIADVHLLVVDNIFGYGLCESMRDLVLPISPISEVLPSLDAVIHPANHAEALALLDEYSDLLSSGPHGFDS